MRPMTAITAAVLASLGLAATAKADPFDPKRVPADAKWVLHVDVDTARGTKMGAALQDMLAHNDQFQEGLGKIKEASRLHFPEDLHDVTLYGRAPGDEAVVAVIHAKVDRGRLVEALRHGDDAATDAFGTYDVQSWTDKGNRMFGAFHDDDTFIVGRSADGVRAALDVIDGKAAVVAADSILAGAAPPTTRPAADGHPLAYAAVVDLAAMTKPGDSVPAPLRQVEGGWMTVSEDGPDAVLRAQLTGKTAEATKQLRASAEGLRAMLSLIADPTATDPQGRLLAEAAKLAKAADISGSDKALSIRLAVPLEEIKQLGNNGIVHTEVKVGDAAEKETGGDKPGVHFKVEIMTTRPTGK